LEFDGEKRFRVTLRRGRTMLALPKLIQTSRVSLTILGGSKMLVFGGIKELVFIGCVANRRERLGNQYLNS